MRPPRFPVTTSDACLGRGGSATVWLVTEQSTGREFALKCFDADRAAPEESEAEDVMRREVRILSALAHSHLLRVHAWCACRFTTLAAAASGLRWTTRPAARWRRSWEAGDVWVPAKR